MTDCEHTIKWGITAGTCTKCKEYFELDQALQPSMNELAAQNGVDPYARYEDDNY